MKMEWLLESRCPRGDAFHCWGNGDKGGVSPCVKVTPHELGNPVTVYHVYQHFTFSNIIPPSLIRLGQNFSKIVTSVIVRLTPEVGANCLAKCCIFIV